MKYILLLLVAVFSGMANAVEYTNLKVTGIGLADADSGYFRFTIDADPNVVILTRRFQGEQQKMLVSMVLTAYATQSTIAYLKTEEATSANTKHYTELKNFEIGQITHD